MDLAPFAEPVSRLGTSPGPASPLAPGQILSAMSDLVVVVDESGRLEFISESARALLGQDPTAWTGRDAFDLIHPDDVGLAAEALASSVEAGPGPKTPIVLRIADGSSRWRTVEIVSTYLAPSGRPGRLVVVAREGLQHERAKKDRRAVDHRFERAFEHAPIGMALVTDDGILARVNSALELMIGGDRVALTGSPVLDLVHPDDRERARRHAMAVMSDDAVHRIELRFVRVDGSAGWAQVTSTLLRDDAGHPEHTVVHLQDITEPRRLRSQLEFAASHDPLTGLLNRSGFERRFGGCERRENMRALLVIDLDRFKPVNDRFGHAAGDALLIQVSERLRSSARSDDAIGRLGGDEFTLLSCSIDSPQAALAFGERVRERLSEVFVLEKGSVEITGSIGAALLDGDVALDCALAAADRAAYVAKHNGGDRTSLTWCSAPPSDSDDDGGSTSHRS